MSVDSAAISQCGPGADLDRRPRSVILKTPAAGMIWFCGWLFTIGVAGLGFWKSVLALVAWPYFLGVLAS